MLGIKTKPKLGSQIVQLSARLFERVEQEKYELFADEKYPLPIVSLGTHRYGYISWVHSKPSLQ